MKNCLILGSGRSGTSMVAGTLSRAGYFMGGDMMPPTVGNPKGYFESFDVEDINERLIQQVIPARPKGFLNVFFRHRPERAQRWLALVPIGAKINARDDLILKIGSLTQKEPYCFKDPRLCYTLPAWRPFLKNNVFICVFRHPSVTANSILTECNNEPYLANLSINYKRALQVWTLMYKHILESHVLSGRWLFLHYNQVLTSEGMDKLEEFTGAKVDRSFPTAKLSRSGASEEISKTSLDVYQKLCELSGYQNSSL
jgi:hypothetical protein